jgi:hypothetical protein
MPRSLAVAFQPSREIAVISNQYLQGEVQRSVLVETSRKRWKQTKKLTAAELAALRTFYLARRGGTEEFYFYDLYETDPVFSYDETGAESDGRYAVRFEGKFQSSLGMARNQVDVELVEVS